MGAGGTGNPSTPGESDDRNLQDGLWIDADRGWHHTQPPDAAGGCGPPHPDTRTWRHPSEIGGDFRLSTTELRRSGRPSVVGICLVSAAAGALCAFGVLGITGSLSASTAQLRPRSAPPTGTLEGSSMPVVPIPHTTLMLTTTQDMSVGAHTRVSLPDRVTTAKVVQVQPTLRMSLLVDIGRSTPIGTAPARRTAGSDTQIGDGLSCVQHRVQVKAAARGTAARMPAAEPRRVQLASGDTALGTYRSQQGPMPAGCAVVDVSGELVGMAIGYDDNPDDDVHYLLTVDGARTLFEQSASEPHG